MVILDSGVTFCNHVYLHTTIDDYEYLECVFCGRKEISGVDDDGSDSDLLF